MKICMISGGHLPIPAAGWGGVEVLITNYFKELKNIGHEVLVCNTGNLEKVNEVVNEWSPDFVHLHYDQYSEMMSGLKCSKKAITSHYPYIDYPEIANNDGYSWIYDKIAKQDDSYIFGLSDLNKEVFLTKGVADKRLRKWVYGIPHESFRFSSAPKLRERTVCLGKIEPRKKQAFLQPNVSNVDFVGPLADDNFDGESKNYLGVWNRKQVHENLTEYANMVLFSDGESAPQVVYEGLISGCGLVVSKEASANLDTSLPFITVLDIGCDKKEIDEAISQNREISIKYRKEIRDYGLSNFSIKACARNYVKMVENLEGLI